MNILQRYLYKKLIINFLGAIFLFVCLFIFSKLSEQINHLVSIAEKTPLSEMVLYFIYEIPFSTIYILPMSTLFSVVFALGKLNETHELYIFRTTGHSIWYYMAPFILTVFLICTFVAVFNEEILYGPHQEHRRLHHKFRGSVYQAESDQENLIQFGKNQKLYIIDYLKTQQRELSRTRIFFFDKNKKFNKIVTADKVIYDTPTNTTFTKFRQFKLDKNKVSFTFNETKKIYYNDKFEYFKPVFHTPEDLSSDQIAKEIQKVKTIGGNKDSLLTEYYFKIASPYISLILVFLGIPLSVFSRNSVMIISFFLVIITAFLYMVFFNIGISLGKSGIIPPMLGGWLGNIVFTLAAVGLNYISERK